MHPEILRELTAQRSREMQTRAHQATLARVAARVARVARRGRGLPDEADGFTLPAIPDYADGSFRTETAGEPAPGGAAARRAA